MIRPGSHAAVFPPSGLLLAFDPALLRPGVAVYYDGELVGARRVGIPTAWSLRSIGDRAASIAGECAAVLYKTVCQIRADGRIQTARVAIEKPKIYPPGKLQEKRPNPDDILALAWVAGALVDRLSTTWALETVCPEPGEWSGGIPKEERGPVEKCPRWERLVLALSDAELARVERKHDAMDAAGIGAWALGRWHPPRVNHRPGGLLG